MSEIDYEHIAAVNGCSVEYVRRMIELATVKPLLLPLKWHPRMESGDIVVECNWDYKINPRISAVEILQRAVVDAGYEIVNHRSLLRKEKPSCQSLTSTV